jgi:hypothetical protein
VPPQTKKEYSTLDRVRLASLVTTLYAALTGVTHEGGSQAWAWDVLSEVPWGKNAFFDLD